MRYKCNNPQCSKFGESEFYSNETYKYINGKLTGENSLCPSCGKEREEINPNKDIPLSQKNLAIAEYSSASPEKKREMLKKRSHDHFDSHVKERKDYLMDKAMKEMKNLGK